MKFDYASDLHINAGMDYNRKRRWLKNEITCLPWKDFRQSNTLVIGGDISNDAFTTIKAVREAAKFYDDVIFVDGNHEFYETKRMEMTVGNFVEHMQKSLPENVQYLNGEFFVVDDVAFVGANGWYNWNGVDWMDREAEMEEWKLCSNDSRCIRYDSGGFPDKLAFRDAENVSKTLHRLDDEEDIRKIVVVTHTVPLQKALVTDVPEWVPLNGSYYNSHMEKVFRAYPGDKLSHWLFGHTHYFHDFVENGVNFICHPRGYPGEKRVGEWTGFRQIEV